VPGAECAWAIQSTRPLTPEETETAAREVREKSRDCREEEILRTQQSIASATGLQIKQANDELTIGAIGTGTLVLATILLGVAFRATQRTAKLAEKAFLASNRPRLILREARALTAGEPKFVTGVYFAIANAGETPARIQHAKFCVQFRAGSEPAMQLDLDGPWLQGDFDNPIAVGHLLQPGVFVDGSLTLAEKSPPVSADSTQPTLLSRAGAHPCHLCFYGKIRYLDLAGVPRNMAFYRILHGKTFRFVPFDDAQLEYADDGR